VRLTPASLVYPSILMSMLILEYADHIAPPRHTPKTASKYEAAVLRFITWAEKDDIRQIGQVSFQVLSRFVRHLRDEKCGASWINRHISALNSFLKFAMDEKHIEENPMEGPALRRLRLKEPRPSPTALTLSNEHISAFLEASRHLLHPAYSSLFEATAGCGARLDEMRHIDLSNIDEEKGYLIITPKPGWTTKSYRHRRVPISSSTVVAMKRFIATRSQVPMDDKTIWQRLRKVSSKLPGVPKFSMHDLRRAWASAMHNGGASMKRVSSWLGHSAVQVTERYIRLTDVEGGHEFLPR
jgi:site-specific recombinase XerD